MDTLPNGWGYSKIGELMQPSKERYNPVENDNRVFIGLEHIESGSGKILGRGDSSEVKSLKSVFNAGDILYGKLRPYLNKVIVPDFNGVCSTDLLVFPKNEYVLSKYLAYYMMTPPFVQFATQNMSGVQHPRVKYETLANYTVPIPPFNEQVRIVAQIEELFSRLDAGVRSLQAAQKRLEQYRQATLQQAYTGKITTKWRKENKDSIIDIQDLFNNIQEKRKVIFGKNYKKLNSIEGNLEKLPNGWIWVKSQEVCYNITNGYTPKKDKMYEEGDVPFIKIYNLEKYGFVNFKIKPTYIDYDTHNKELKRSKVYPNDILMNIVGPPLGKVSIVPNDFPEWNINQAIVFFRPIEGYNINFLFYCLSSEFILLHLRKQAKATAGQYNISVNMCRNLPIPFISENEQIIISNKIEELFSDINYFKKTIRESISFSELLRSAILKRAFEGKLVPQDPNDEPASVFIERIKDKGKKQTKLM